MAGERILVVDDHVANVKLVRVVLEHAGYEVRTAADAESALREVSALKPRLILMDVRLPGMDGLALTRLLMADPATKDIVVVALTASTTHGDEERARSAGCYGYLAKPIDVGSLADFVAEVLAARPATP